MDLDWQRIRHMAKWVCILCFEMKGAAIFDWTVLLCGHLVCIKCFKKNADFLKTMRTCHCGATFLTFPESVRLYRDAYSQWESDSWRDIINSFLSLLRHFLFFFHST